MVERCWAEDHVHIRLDKETLWRWVVGVKNKAQSNGERGWLTEEEEKTIVDYTIKMAEIRWQLTGIEAPILWPKNPTDDKEEDSNRSGEDDDEMIDGNGND